MNDKKAQLQKAIITNNMELVRDFYEYVFSEKAPMILNRVSGESSSELSLYKNRINQAIEILSKGVPAKFDLPKKTIQLKKRRMMKTTEYWSKNQLT